MKANWKWLCALAEQEVTQILETLPEPLRERAGKVPVTLEKRPNIAMQVDGIEEDTLGLFTGPDWAGAGEVPLPPHIILYLENLWEMAENDEMIFREEIKTTFLHELGHFFGFAEDEMPGLELE